MHLSIKTGGLKFVIGWLSVLLIRSIPFRPPNFEPMLAVVMPFSKRYTLISSFCFGFLGIIAFDIISGYVGMWTIITALAYGFLGVWSYYFFKNRKGTTRHFVYFGIVSTLAYDAVTGLSVGPLFFGQPFLEALVGQIPFTVMHLAGTMLFSAVVSPILYRFVIEPDTLEIPVLIRNGKLLFSRF